jgi:hypothetical protein
MTELMILVERAVRPVRAAPARKMRMREELLAHLTGIYDEDRARLGDDALALRRAAERFGDPAALTADLQATVPRVERVLGTPVAGQRWEWQIARWFQQRPGEGAIRHAARLAAVFAASVPAVAYTIAAVQYLATGAWSPLQAAPAAVVSAHAFVSAMLCVGFFTATAGRLTWRAVAVAAGCAAGLVAGGPALVAALAVVQPDNPLWESEILRGSGRPLGVVLAGLFWLAVWAMIVRVAVARQRRATPWMELQIDG